jgi:hypothetical protein
MPEEEQTIDVVGNYQPRDANVVFINTQDATPTKAHQRNQNIRIKPSIAIGSGR